MMQVPGQSLHDLLAQPPMTARTSIRQMADDKDFIASSFALQRSQ